MNSRRLQNHYKKAISGAQYVAELLTLKSRLIFDSFSCVITPQNAECSLLAYHLDCETVILDSKPTSGQILIPICI